jgi:hypothetical protein
MIARSLCWAGFLGALWALLSACESYPPERKPDPNAPSTQVKRLTSKDAKDGDRMGGSVGIDGEVIIVGTNMFGSNNARPGQAFIFSQNQGGTDTWGQTARLVASDGEDADMFGNSVAISGDNAISGAGWEDNVDIDVGSAYLFSRNLGGVNNWGQLKKLTSSDGQNGDGFGFAVSIDGDAAVVGAPYKSTTAWASGVAYAFSRNQGGADNWGQVRKLVPSDFTAAATFGFSVAVSGDTIVVGAVNDNGTGSYRGAAYVFCRDLGGAGNWGEAKKLTAFDAEDRDAFGCSVAISGDFLIVGAGVKHESGVETGAAYIFGRNQGGADNWGLIKRLRASDAAPYDGFGASVSISADYALVGATGKDGTIPDIGGVYIFQRDLGGADNWGEVGNVMPADANETCWFGQSVALSGDLFVVGAPEMRGGGQNRGAAYVFRIKS